MKLLRLYFLILLFSFAAFFENAEDFIIDLFHHNVEFFLVELATYEFVQDGLSFLQA